MSPPRDRRDVPFAQAQMKAQGMRGAVRLWLAAALAAAGADGRQNRFMSQLDSALPPNAKGCEQIAALLQHCEARAPTWLPPAVSGLFAANCSRQELYLRTCLRAAQAGRLGSNTGAARAPPPTPPSPTAPVLHACHTRVLRPTAHAAPSWESSEDRAVSPPRMSRKQGLTPKVFAREYLATGQPLLVTDAADSWPGATQLCRRRRPPTAPVPLTVASHHGCCGAAMGWDFDRFREAAAELGSVGELRSWNLHVDEARDGPLTLDRYPELLREYPQLYIAWGNRRFKRDSLLQRKHYDYPYFIPAKSRRPGFEWVYIGGQAGPGAVGHIDVLCQCSWAVQIRGSKRWWLQSPQSDGGGEVGGRIYEFVQRPGELLFFCPGWWHKTAIEPPPPPPPGTDPGPAAAGTTANTSLSIHGYIDLCKVWSETPLGHFSTRVVHLLL